jgi:hypothetical protein
VIHVYDELNIAHAAALAVRLEILRAEQSHGLPVDDHKLVRYSNAFGLALARLRLRYDDDDDDRAPRGQAVARQRWQTEQAAKSADPGATAMQDTGAPDDRRRTAAE